MIVHCRYIVKNSELYEKQFVCDTRKVYCLYDSSPAIAVERFSGVVSGRGGTQFPNRGNTRTRLEMVQ